MTAGPGISPSIGNYAIIGDCRSAALISRSGSLDWLCWPRFDSPSLFARVLDERRGGCFAVRPVGAYGVERRYAGRTNVLETTCTTGTGSLRLTDFMPVASEEDKSRELLPDHETLRFIDGLEGFLDVETLYAPRLDYGRVVPRFRRPRAARVLRRAAWNAGAVAPCTASHGAATIRRRSLTLPRCCTDTSGRAGRSRSPPLPARHRSHRRARCWRALRTPGPHE